MVHMIYCNHEIKSWATCPASELNQGGLNWNEAVSLEELSLFVPKFPNPLDECDIEICIWTPQEKRDCGYMVIIRKRWMDAKKRSLCPA